MKIWTFISAQSEYRELLLVLETAPKQARNQVRHDLEIDRY